MGLRASVQIGARTYTLLVVRPPNSAVSHLTPAVIAQQIKNLAWGDYLILSSFGPALGATQAVAAWQKEGMFDPLERTKNPGPKPTPA